MTDEADIARVRKKLARATNAMHKVAKNDKANLGEKIGDVSFANIEAVLTTVKEALQEENLAVSQPFTIVHNQNQSIMTVDTMITCEDTGQYLLFQGPGFPVKGAPQEAGGAITYFRRYGLVSFFGLIVDDDDGTQATRSERTPQARTEAETAIRSWLANQPDDQKAQFAADFKEAFGGLTLSALPPNKHGEALSFQKFWYQKSVTGETPAVSDTPPTESEEA